MVCFVATTLCFNERAIYTHDVLAVVIQQLVEVNPIPVLFMRTVLQTLSFYPTMVRFVMSILQRLIIKQVGLETRASKTDRDRENVLGVETSAYLGRFHQMLSEDSFTFVSFAYSITTPSTETCLSSRPGTSRRTSATSTVVAER